MSKAAIVVGLPVDVMFDVGYERSPLLRFIEPTEDAKLEDSLVGIVLVGTTGLGYKEVATSIETQANRKLFKELTGKEAKVYLTVVQDY